VPFSDTNPPPIEETAPPPPPATKPEPPKPAIIKTAITPAIKPQPSSQPTATEATTATNTDVYSTSTNELATAVPVSVESVKPVEQIKAVAKKIAAVMADNNIVKNLPTPRTVEFTADNAKRQASLSFWLFLLVGLSATVINEAVKKFNESPNRLRLWWKNKSGGWSDFFLKHSLVRKLLVLLTLLGYGALIVVAEAPNTLASGLATLVPVLAAVLIFLLIKEGGEKIFLKRGGADSWLIFSGAGLLILLLGVIISRGVNLLPPLLLSAPIILVSLKTTRHNEILAKSKTVILTLGTLTAFWFSSYVNNPLWQGAVLLVCAVGIQDLFFSLIPLNPLPGHLIFKTNFMTWLILSILTTLGFVFIILSPNNATGSLTIPWTSSAIYAGVATVIWLGLKIFSRRKTTLQ
jgi:hypothetical protein